MIKKYVLVVFVVLFLLSGKVNSFAQEKKTTPTPAAAPATTPVVEEKKVAPAPAAAPATEEKKTAPTPLAAPATEEKKVAPAVAPAPAVEEKKPTIEEKKIVVTVQSVEGTARLQLVGSNQFEIIKPGMTLSPGDTIMAFAKSKVMLKFEDESTIELQENSIFTVKELKKTVVVETKEEKKESHLVLSLGKANTKTKKLGPKDKFEIYTPAAVCSVRGTVFTVEVDDKKETKVQVLEGIVGVKEASGLGGEMLVKQNQQLVVQPGTAPSIPEAMPPEKTEVPAKEEKKGEKAAKPGEGTKAGEAGGPPPKEGKPKDEGKGKGFGMGGNFGAVTLTDEKTKEKKVYSQVSLQPEFSFGKFGVGLDLYFYFDEANNLRQEDWDGPEDILTKIMYLRYGKKKDPVYVYLGVFPGVTLGHGLIMNRYSNMLKYPDERKIGFELDLDFGLVGFESLVTDLQCPEIFGGRAYIRPLWRSGIPILKKLAIGGSGVHDIDTSNPNSKGNTEGDSVSILGVDLDLPLTEKPLFTSIAYADAARMEVGSTYVDVSSGAKNGGMGYAFGFMGNIVKFIGYRIEYRGSQKNFISQYFDAYYENVRASKPFSIAKKNDSDIDQTKQGPYMEIGFNLLGKVSFVTTYEKNNIDDPYLYSAFSVDPALLLNKYSFSVSYAKKGSDPIMTTQVGYQVSGGVFLILTKKKTFDRFTGQSIEMTYIETRMKL